MKQNFDPTNMKEQNCSRVIGGLRWVGLCAVAAVLCACASSSVKKTWKSPALQAPVGKIAVITIEERGRLRQILESDLVNTLIKAGATAGTTFGQFPLAEIKQDKRKAADQLAAGGVEAVAMMRLVDAATVYREVQPGGERYASTITGFESMGWYDYYSVAFMSMSPTYSSVKWDVYIDTSIYDLKTEKRVWSGLTRTVLSEDMDRRAQVEPLTEKIVAAMKKDGVVR